MAFSGAIKLGDLNDFIAPSQACVVTLAPNAKLPSVDLQVDTVQLPPTRQDPKGFQQTQLAGDAVKVSLQDCLACSGCVTSAETVLLEHQSTGELMSALQSSKVVIVSVSPQSRASLGVLHQQSPTQTAGKLAHFFRSLGVRFVLDTTSSRDIALLEAAQEFIARYTTKHPEFTISPAASAPLPPDSGSCMEVAMQDRHQSNEQAGTIYGSAPLHVTPQGGAGTPPKWVAAQSASPRAELASDEQMVPRVSQPTGMHSDGQAHGSSSNESHKVDPGGALPSDDKSQHNPAKCNSTQHDTAQHDPGPLPVLASACPGWVCYAEKTHGSYILPYISTTKSPQAVMGTLVKRHLAKQLGLDPAQIYHCAVMPCYDKKLEGSRDDFMIPGTSIPETDSILTTSEVQQLIEQQAVSFAELPCAPMDSLLGPSAPQEQLHGVHGGSGGYLEFVFRTAAQELFHKQLPAEPLQMRTLRNADFKEVTLEVQGRTVLRFAAAYGFRNIQTLVRKVKRQACEYDYVEVMACPAGCLNGGGQIKAHKGQSTQQLLDDLDQNYHAPELAERHPKDNPLVPAVYQQFIGGGLYGAAARDLLHTSYHHREKTVSATIGDW